MIHILGILNFTAFLNTRKIGSMKLEKYKILSLYKNRNLISGGTVKDIMLVIVIIWYNLSNKLNFVQARRFIFQKS